MAFIQISNLFKTYKTHAGDFTALNNLNLEIEKGKFVAIVGKSGAGKSTFVNMLTGVDQITSGEIWVNQQPIHTMKEDKLAQWRGKNVGVVYQSFELLPQLSLLDNVLLSMDFNGNLNNGVSKTKALSLFEDVEILEHAYKKPDAISGGQKQRVAIARALANDPDLIVADEPTGSLDSVTAKTILNLFQDLTKKGKTVVMVTHDKTIRSKVDSYIMLQDGKIVEIQ
jgi:putative ABC transport system ATP-binding protein